MAKGKGPRLMGQPEGRETDPPLLPGPLGSLLGLTLAPSADTLPTSRGLRTQCAARRCSVRWTTQAEPAASAHSRPHCVQVPSSLQALTFWSVGWGAWVGCAEAARDPSLLWPLDSRVSTMHRATRKEPPVLPSCLSVVIGHIVASCLAQWLVLSLGQASQFCFWGDGGDPSSAGSGRLLPGQPVLMKG